MEKIIKKKFKVEGLDCASCCILIDDALEDLDGVESASTNYARCECYVEFDEEKVSQKDILRVVEDTGYKVAEIPT